MDYEEQQEALCALRDARKWVQQVHDDAESKHDNYGEFYMDSLQYEIMLETEKLIDRIDKSLRYLEKANACALIHLEEAQHWLQQRTIERMRRGVEGTHTV